MTEREPAYFAKIGKRGGDNTKAKHDADYYRMIGRMGGLAGKHKRKKRRRHRIEEQHAPTSNIVVQTLDDIIAQIEGTGTDG